MRYKYMILQLLILGVLMFVSGCDTEPSTDKTTANVEMPSRFDSKAKSPLIKLRGIQDEQLAIQIYPAPGTETLTPWRLLRHYPSGHLELQKLQGGSTYQPVPTDPAFKLNAYPMLVLPYEDRLYILVYDVVRNVPSGRRLSVSEPGYDLYEAFLLEKEPQIKLLAQGLDIGGIDTLVYGNAKEDGVDLCAGNQCVSIERDGGRFNWNTASLAQYEFVELKFFPEGVFALIRSKHDGTSELKEQDANIKLASIKPSDVRVETINMDEGIPYDLLMMEGKVRWNTAKTLDDVRSLLLYDLGRMPHYGWIDFGQNNLEGRVAWSQVYYLNGLISLLDQKHGLKYLPNEQLCKMIEPSVRMEVDLLAKLANQDYPDFKVKRYSMEREPLLFALHLGRIVHMLKRSEDVGLDSTQVASTIDSLCHEMKSLQHTVEEMKEETRNGITTLRYKAHYPFWADGVNVPYNYISGYVQGLLKACYSDDNVERSKKLMEPLIKEVSNERMTWPYWWGVGDEGWQKGDGVSINTAQWNGNKQGKAHITYRSMDVAALVTLYYRLNENLVPTSMISQFRELVHKGWLLPQVNESFSEIGQAEPLSEIVIRRYARSAAAWELNSQIWALDQLAGNFKDEVIDSTKQELIIKVTSPHSLDTSTLSGTVISGYSSIGELLFSIGFPLTWNTYSANAPGEIHAFVKGDDTQSDDDIFIAVSQPPGSRLRTAYVTHTENGLIVNDTANGESYIVKLNEKGNYELAKNSQHFKLYPYRNNGYVYNMSHAGSMLQACRADDSTRCDNIKVNDNTFPFVYAGNDKNTVVVTNWGDVLFHFKSNGWFRGKKIGSSFQHDEKLNDKLLESPRKMQMYSSIKTSEGTLLGEWPTGRIWELGEGTLRPRKDGPYDQDKFQNLELQSMALFGGDLYAGYWPQGEVWKKPLDKKQWKKVRRLFSHPEVHSSTKVPYLKDKRHDGLGEFFFGQRASSMATYQNSLFISTSNLGDWDKAVPDPEFLTQDQINEYGAIYYKTKPNCWTAVVKNNVNLCVKLSSDKLTIYNNDIEIAQTKLIGFDLARLNSVKKGGGIFGPLSDNNMVIKIVDSQ